MWTLLGPLLGLERGLDVRGLKALLIDFLANLPQPPKLSPSSQPSSPLSWIISIAWWPCMTRPIACLTSRLGIQCFLTLLQPPTASGIARHAPKGVLPLLFLRPGLLLPDSGMAPSFTSLLTSPHYSIFLVPALYCSKECITIWILCFVYCLPPLECDLHEVQVFVLSTAMSQCWKQCLTHDWFLVNAGISALNFPFSSPTRSPQEHLLRKVSESTLTGWPLYLKGKSKGEIVAGFFSIWANGIYKEPSSCEVNHQRIWSLTFCTSSCCPGRCNPGSLW